MKFVHALAILAAAAADAQRGPRPGAPIPTKPVKVIVPFAPGGPSDVTARIIFAEMSKNIGKQFFIENHAGGAANIGITLAARAAPDGYTVLLTSSSLWLNPNTYAKVAYDPVEGLHPDLAGRDHAELAGGASVRAGEDREGAGRHDPRRARQIHHRQSRHRHAAASVRRTVQACAEARHDVGAVRRRRPDDPVGRRRATRRSRSRRCRRPRRRSAPARSARSPSPRSSAAPRCPTSRPWRRPAIPGQEGDTPQGMLVPAGTPQPIVDFLYRELMKVMQTEDVKRSSRRPASRSSPTRRQEFAPSSWMTARSGPR